MAKAIHKSGLQAVNYLFLKLETICSYIQPSRSDVFHVMMIVVVQPIHLSRAMRSI